MPDSPPVTAPAGERQLPAALYAAVGALLLASGWSVWTGIDLGTWRGRAQAEAARLERIQAAVKDDPFRSELAAAVKTLSDDAQDLRTRLKAMGQRLGTPVDGTPTLTPYPDPSRGYTDIVVALSLKDLSMSRFLDFARTVELEIPDAVLKEVSLKPIKDAGDRWEASLKIARRTQLGP